MPTKFDEVKDLQQARARFVKRRTAQAEINRLFADGDHWQAAKGYIGAKPLLGVQGYYQTLLQIKDGFVSENIIGEIVDRHIPGILGREPLWGAIPQETFKARPRPRQRLFRRAFSFVFGDARETKPAESDMLNLAQEADDCLTDWWDEKRPRSVLKEAERTCLLEEFSTLRVYIPDGLVDKSKPIPKLASLSEALALIHVEALTSDKAGVFTDSETQLRLGIFTSKRDGEEYAELTYLADTGETTLRQVTEREAGDPIYLNLGGRLLLYDLRRPPLITAQVCSNQRSLNLADTMMMRNVNLAGSLERTVLNAERPKKRTRVADPTAPGGYREKEEPADYEVGPGATMFLSGLLIRDDQTGKIIGRANPNISFRDPVSVDTFVKTRDHYYAAMLGQCQQRHALISGDATASGRSREQARAEFEGSLKLTKESLDDAGRWLLETVLRLAAQLCARTNEFAPLRIDFNSLIDTGPLSSEERAQNRADVQQKLLSAESAMSRAGVEDTDAELTRIGDEAKERAKTTPPPPPNNPEQRTELVQ